MREVLLAVAAAELANDIYVTHSEQLAEELGEDFTNGNTDAAKSLLMSKFQLVPKGETVFIEDMWDDEGVIRVVSRLRVKGLSGDFYTPTVLLLNK